MVVLVISTMTDLKSRLIYDKVTYPALVYMLLARIFVRDEAYWIYPAGLFVLGGITLLLALVSRGQVGGGDIKLFAVVGAALGWELGLAAMLASYIVSGIPALAIVILRPFMKKRLGQIKSLPMAPFIMVGTLLILLVGQV